MSPRAADMPDLGAPTADSHAHLAMLEDPVGALANAAEAGVDLIVDIGYPLEQQERAAMDAVPGWLEAAEARSGRPAPEVRFAAGVHPHEARLYDAAAEETLREVHARHGLVAVGETGLDHHYDHSPRPDQRRAFERHLELADELELPAIVHLREAHDEGADMLRRLGVPRAGCVIHCFGEDAATAARFLEMGCHVSFSGIVTFKRADAVREAARAVPPERLLIETDCPFLAPEPMRGKKNEPAFVTLVAEVVARAKGMSAAEIAGVTRGNADSLFAARERGSGR